MAGRKREFSEERVLQCAARLFMVRGYASTSTEDLLQAMNINKGSLYHTFGSKRELFMKVLQYYADRYVDSFVKGLEQSKDPVADIKDSFLDVARKGTRASFIKGCFLGNTVLEQAGLDRELKKIAAETLKKLEGVYCHHIAQAQAAGQLETEVHAGTLARHLTNLWNGIHITARMYSSPGELLPVIQMNLALIR